MRIFATADLHGKQEHYDNVKAIVAENNIECVMFAGDLCPNQTFTNLDGTITFQAEWFSDHFYYFRSELRDMGIGYAYTLGNDDWIDDPSPEWWGFSRRYIKQNFIFRFPYVNPCYKINVYSNRERNEKEQRLELRRLGNCKGKIILAHNPPYQCCDKTTSGEHIGSKAVLQWIYEQQPSIWLCGHCHEDYGSRTIDNTIVFNCACNRELTRGFIIDYDEVNNKVLDYMPVRKEA
jgi:Icc-related predicted phosphoesterase